MHRPYGFCIGVLFPFIVPHVYAVFHRSHGTGGVSDQMQIHRWVGLYRPAVTRRISN